jgi:integrase
MPRSVASKAEPAAGPMPIDKFEGIILDEYKARGAASSTISVTHTVFRALKDGAGVRTALDLTHEETIRRLDEINPYENVHTRRGFIARFCRVVRRGHQLGILPSLPTLPAVGRIKPKPPPRRSSPSADVVRSFLDRLAKDADAWEGRRLHALASTVARAGIGLHQALRLRVADVDLAGSAIWLTGGRWRRSLRPVLVPIRIDAELRSILAGWIRRTKCEWAFPGIRRRSPWRVKSAALELAIACRDAGFKRMTFESLRLAHSRNAALSIPAGSFATTPARPISATPGPGAVPSVDLGDPGELPLVRGKPKRPVTRAQHRAIQILLEAWPGGLSKAGMDRKYGGLSWRQNLLRLRKDADWAGSIGFPGMGSTSSYSDLYRILPR